MSLIEHAKREFAATAWIDKETGEFKDELQSEICKDVLELLEVFSKQGHSGTSGLYVIELLYLLASYKPILPLTGEDSEWTEVADGVYQNIRCSRVFKQADRFDGQAYDIEGKIFYTVEKDNDGSEFKSYFTNSNSFVPIIFPYTPIHEYVEVNKED